MRIVSAASMAMLAYVSCPPGFPLGKAHQDLIALSENQIVRSPRLRSPASYLGQLRIRYEGLEYLYWLRFGYFIGGNSGCLCQFYIRLRYGAMHQRLPAPRLLLAFCKALRARAFVRVGNIPEMGIVKYRGHSVPLPKPKLEGQR